MSDPRKITVRTVTYTHGMFTAPNSITFLHMATLVDTLHGLKEAAVEEHTRNNIQSLIDTLVTMRVTA